MALKARLAEQSESTERAPDTDDSVDPETPSISAETDAVEPFLQNYKTGEYEMDADTTDQALSLLIAVTNLL